MVVTLALMLAAGAAIALRKDPLDSPGESSTAPKDSGEPPRNSTRVERWRPYVSAAAGGVPVDFLMRWIQRESDGDPASTGTSREVGIGQLYFSDGNTLYGYSIDELRSSAHDPSDLTAEQLDAQVGSLVALAKDCLLEHAAPTLQRLGLAWSGDDILALTKLWHALPVLVSAYLPACAQAGAAATWDDFRAWARALSFQDAVGIWSGANRYWGAAGLYGFERFFRNAAIVGRGDAQ